MGGRRTRVGARAGARRGHPRRASTPVAGLSAPVLPVRSQGPGRLAAVPALVPHVCTWLAGLLGLALLIGVLLVPAATAAPPRVQEEIDLCPDLPDYLDGPLNPCDPDSPTNPGNAAGSVAREAARGVLEELLTTPEGDGEVTDETIDWIVTAPNLGAEEDDAPSERPGAGQAADDPSPEAGGGARGDVDLGGSDVQLAAPVNPGGPGGPGGTQTQAGPQGPNFANGNKLNGLRERMTAIALALLGATMTFGIIHYWVSGLSAAGGGGIELGDALLRAVGAMLAILLWPTAFDYAVMLQRIVSAAVLDGASTSFIASSLTGLLAATALTGPGIALIVGFILAIGIFLMLLGLVILKIVMNSVLALLFVGMPLLLALWPFSPLAWLTNFGMRAFTVVVLAPLIWAICFATTAALGDDVIGPAGFLPFNALMFIAMLYVSWAVPWKLMSVVGLGLPFGGAISLFAKIGGMAFMVNGLANMIKKHFDFGGGKGGKDGDQGGETDTPEPTTPPGPSMIDLDDEEPDSSSASPPTPGGSGLMPGASTAMPAAAGAATDAAPAAGQAGGSGATTTAATAAAAVAAGPAAPAVVGAGAASGAAGGVAGGAAATGSAAGATGAGAGATGSAAGTAGEGAGATGSAAGAASTAGGATSSGAGAASGSTGGNVGSSATGSPPGAGTSRPGSAAGSGPTPGGQSSPEPGPVWAASEDMIRTSSIAEGAPEDELFQAALWRADARENGGEVSLERGAEMWNRLEPPQQQALVAKQEVANEEDQGKRFKRGTRGFLVHNELDTSLEAPTRRAYADLAAMSMEDRAQVIPPQEQVEAREGSYYWSADDMQQFAAMDAERAGGPEPSSPTSNGGPAGSATPSPSGGASPRPAPPPSGGGSPGPATPPPAQSAPTGQSPPSQPSAPSKP